MAVLLPIRLSASGGLPAPGNIVVTPDDLDFDVTFDAVTGALSYRWRIDGGAWTSIGTSTSFSGTTTEGDHTIEVQAIGAGSTGSSDFTAVPPPADPASISGLVAWYKGESGRYDATVAGSLVTTDGAVVKRWEDQSGNGNHVTQGTSANCPLKSGNYLIAGDNTKDQWLTLPSIAMDPQSMSVFAILEVENSRYVNSGTNVRYHFLLSLSTANMYVDGDDGKFYGNSGSGTARSGGLARSSLSLMGYAGGAAATDVILNETVTTTAETPGAPATGGDILGAAGGGVPAGARVVDYLIYDRRLTGPEIAIIQEYAETRGAVFGTTATRAAGITGDSISQGGVNTELKNWINQTTKPADLEFWNASQAGITLATLYSERASRDDLLYRSGIPNVLFITGGSNDIFGATSAAALATLVSDYGTAEKVVGYDKVVIITILPRTDVAGANETARTTYNTARRGDFGIATVPAYADGIMDWAADPIHGDVATDTSLFPDGVHPSNTLAATMAKYVPPFINATGYEISGPSAGVYTVTIASGGEFRGQMKIRLAASAGTIDATAAGGTITGDGTATVTVTPAAGETSFTFEPSGAMTVTFTNAQGWTDPSNLVVP